ncbi:MAG: hypothetical protein II845_01980 [Oscillospiraceae bacterium]|nr:hypothetical protein [Oscillospiraceae bacterium]
MLNKNRVRPLKVYVKVKADFDRTGYMVPTEITWTDGRIFRIDRTGDIRETETGYTGVKRTRYSVVIRGQNRYLYFERYRYGCGSQFGRWFLECEAEVPESLLPSA